jgi:hypothetical protein
MRAPALALIAATATLLAGPVNAQNINTTTGWNGSNYGAPFGDSNTATYGQTFTLGAGATLNSFTFFLGNYQNGAGLTFDAYVSAWTGTKATGPVLWSGTGYSGTGNASMTQYDFVTGSVSLSAGTYVAFLNASPYISGDENLQTMGLNYGDVLAGGSWVYSNNGSNFASLYSNDWNVVGVYDAAFMAEFDAPTTVTPEPVTMTLLGTGLAGMAAARRRRKTVTA